MKGPRQRFIEWLLEKGEPIFTFFEETLHLSQPTVLFAPVVPFFLIAAIKDWRKGKRGIATVEFIGLIGFIWMIIFSQITLDV